MAEQQFYDHYRAYKKGTSKIARWLFETARALRREQEDFPTQNSNSSVPQLTSKANAPYIIALKVKDFLHLAQEIASSVANPVSTQVVSALQSVISDRKICVELKAVTGEDDAGHTHFIQILEKVLVLLLPLARCTLARSLVRDTTENLENNPTHRSRATNRFQCLSTECDSDVDSPTSPFANAEGATAIPGTPTKPTVEYQLVDDPLMDDPVMTLILGILNYADAWNNYREENKRNWTAYANGQVSLIQATLTSNFIVDELECGMSSMFDEEINLLPVFRKVDGEWLRNKIDGTMVSIFTTATVPRGEDDGGQRLTSWSNTTAHARAALVTFNAWIQQRIVANDRRGKLRIPPDSIHSESNLDENLMLRYRDLTNHLDDHLRFLESYGPGSQQDPYLFRVMWKTRISSAIVRAILRSKLLAAKAKGKRAKRLVSVTGADMLALILYGDFDECLEPVKEKPLESLDSTVDHLLAWHQQSIAFSRSAPFSHDQDRTRFRQILTVLTGHVMLVNEFSGGTSSESSNTRTRDRRPQRFLLSRLPELSGTLVVNLLDSWRDAERAYCNILRDLPAAAFLYRGAEDATGPWPDIDAFVGYFNEPLLKCRSTGFVQAFGWLRRWFGLEVRPSPSPTLMDSAHGSRLHQLKRPTTVFTVLVRSATREPSNPGELQHRHWEAARSLEPVLPAAVRSTAHGRKPSAAERVDAVSKAIGEQEEMLLFNILSLGRRVHELYRKIQQELQHISDPGLRGLLALGGPRRLSTEVSDILAQACGIKTATSDNRCGKSEQGRVIINVMRQLIVTEGSAEIEECEVLKRKLFVTLAT